MKTKFVISTLLSFALFMGLITNAQAGQKWTIKGKVKVNHLLPELDDILDDEHSVHGVEVKVYARSRVLGIWGTWNSWGKKKTGKDGSFSFTEEHNGDRRQFKVEILFDSDRLRIKEGQETGISWNTEGFPIDIDFDLTDKDWHEIHNDKDDGPDDGRKAGVINLGDIYISRTLVRKHAGIWALYNEIFDLFESYGSSYAFKKKQIVKYPMGIGNNNSNASSYNNPLNASLYIKENQFNSNTLIHELMHTVEYQFSTGEDGMVWQLIKHGDTHQTRENTTYVPFLEGWAEWATYKVLREISGEKLRNFEEASGFNKPHLPLNRAYVGAALDESERFLANVDYTERGWHSLFNILTYKALGQCDFNLSSSDKYALKTFVQQCPDAKFEYSFKDVLSIFLKHPSKGIDKYLKTSEMNFMDFLNRAKIVLPDLDDEDVKNIKKYLNPNQDENPRDHHSCLPGVIQSEYNPGQIHTGVHPALQGKGKVKKKKKKKN